MFISWKKIILEVISTISFLSIIIIIIISCCMDFCSEKLVQLVILTIKIVSLHQSCLLKFSLFAHGTLERHQDVFLSGEYCCHETSCERAHSPQISCLKVSSSILSYGNDLQHIAVVDSDSQALHINSTALSLGFMKLTNAFFSPNMHMYLTKIP